MPAPAFHLQARILAQGPSLARRSFTAGGERLSPIGRQGLSLEIQPSSADPCISRNRCFARSVEFGKKASLARYRMRGTLVVDPTDGLAQQALFTSDLDSDRALAQR